MSQNRMHSGRAVFTWGGARVPRMGGVLAGIVVFGALGAGMSGCQEPLLTPDEPRSQFDRYDAVRDQRAPSYVTDEFGIRRPNLRGRLTEKE